MRLLCLLIVLSCSPYSIANETREPTRIVFLGDSLTEGYGIDPKKSYPYLVEAKLNQKAKRVAITNGGVSGSTSASGPSRLKWFLKTKPQIVVLALGANDGLRGLDPKAMKKNLREVIELAKKSQVKVVLAGMMMPLNYGPAYRKSYDAVFRDLAKEYSIPSIPFLLEGVAMDPKLNLPDGIHPNEKGHEKMAETVTAALEPLL